MIVVVFWGIMELFLSIVIWMILGISTSYAAKERGRDPVLWFVIGLLLGIIGLILVFILPKSGSKIKESSEDSNLSAKMLSQQEMLLPADYRLKQWFYLTDEQEQLGPFTFDEITEKKKKAVISDNTFLWCEGLKEWHSYSELITEKS